MGPSTSGLMWASRAGGKWRSLYILYVILGARLVAAEDKQVMKKLDFPSEHEMEEHEQTEKLYLDPEPQASPQQQAGERLPWDVDGEGVGTSILNRCGKKGTQEKKRVKKGKSRSRKGH